MVVVTSSWLRVTITNIRSDCKAEYAKEKLKGSLMQTTKPKQKKSSQRPAAKTGPKPDMLKLSGDWKQAVKNHCRRRSQ